MSARVVLRDTAPSYDPPRHVGVDAARLQETPKFWVGHSVYHPGGAAEMSPTADETVYVVLEGSLRLTIPADDVDVTLDEGDSVHLPKGTVRQVLNTSTTPARLLVVIGVPS